MFLISAQFLSKGDHMRERKGGGEGRGEIVLYHSPLILKSIGHTHCIFTNNF